MARSIAIELEVNGVKESVKTIGELETAIEDLTEELKKTDIGSEKFNQLTNELNKARSELKTFEASFEGLDPQQKTQAYVAFAESVASGILLAQEALRSFGVENENVNNAVEASTKAINFALQSRIVLEGALEARVLATSIAQKALNTSVVAGNKALKVLFTTIAANPLGAVLAVVGLLVTAFISLSNTTEDNTEETDKNNEALERQNQLREAQARIIGQAEDEIRRAREEGLGSLRQEADILEERQRILEEDLKLFQDLAREQLIQINQQKLLGQSTEELEKRYEETTRQLEIAREEAEANAKVLEALRKELENIDKQISRNELDRFSKDLSDAADEVDRLNRNLLEFGETPSPPVIKELENLLELQLKLIETTEESRKTLGDVFNEYNNSVVDAIEDGDKFGKTYEQVRTFLTEAFKIGDVDEFNERIRQVRENFLGATSEEPEEVKRTIAELLSGYETAFNSIISLGVKGTTEFDTLVTPLLEGLTQKLQFEGSINFERIVPLNELVDEISSVAEVGADGVYKVETTIKNAIEEFSLDSETLVEGTTQFYEARQKLINEFTETLFENARTSVMTAEDEASAREKAAQQATEAADKIIETIQRTAEAEDAIRGVFNTFEDLQIKINENRDNLDIFFGLILSNFEDVKEQFNFEFLDPSADLETNYAVIEQFFTDIGAQSVLAFYDTEEEKKEILEFFLAQRQKLLEENADKEKETQEDLLDTTLNNYQEIVNGLNQLTLSLGEASQLQIERIEARREESLNNIVGDTEEAEALRAEITEQANREIVEIERKARLRELQFTKIQAIADLAQALVNAQKLPPPFNAIQSGIVATAGGLQVAVIQSQIDDLQGAQGFSTGGFVSGPGTSTSDSIPALLSDGEFVVNAKSTKKFLPLLERINNQEEQFRRFNNGGFVLDGSSFMGSTIQNNFDDSRIIEELRRTRQEPLRAYVFEKDITEAQQIEKRLQELSKL